MTLTCCVLSAVLAGGQTRTPRHPFDAGRPIELRLASKPVRLNGEDFSILRSGKAIVDRTATGREGETSLKAVLSCAVAQYSDFDYRLVARVFDRQGRVMATSKLTEHVSYIRLGVMPTTFKDLTFEFGKRKDWGRAKVVQFEVDSPKIPVPPDAR
ncbi:MAG: hypothetical protein JST30_00520 [Armatimonadetes bacterium]|nr:hypothetical protein [Armatimonadota bacterium]